MSDVEKAKALLQAAGLGGVAVAETPELVTVPAAELEALRAGAGAAQVPAAAVAPPAGDPVPAGAPAQVQQLGAELAAGTVPGTPPGLPAGILSAEQTEAELSRVEALPAHERNAAMSDQLLASWEHHRREGR